MGGKKPAFVIRELEWKNDKEPTAEVARSAIRRDMANEIKYLLSQGIIGDQKVHPKDIAVLVRSNPDARKIWQYFRECGLPAVVFTDVSLFDSGEAREILWVLEGLVNARNNRAIKRALATGLLGMTGRDFQTGRITPANGMNGLGYSGIAMMRGEKKEFISLCTNFWVRRMQFLKTYADLTVREE